MSTILIFIGTLAYGSNMSLVMPAYFLLNLFLIVRQLLKLMEPSSVIYIVGLAGGVLGVLGDVAWAVLRVKERRGCRCTLPKMVIKGLSVPAVEAV